MSLPAVAEKWANGRLPREISRDARAGSARQPREAQAGDKASGKATKAGSGCSWRMSSRNRRGEERRCRCRLCIRAWANCKTRTKQDRTNADEPARSNGSRLGWASSSNRVAGLEFRMQGLAFSVPAPPGPCLSVAQRVALEPVILRIIQTLRRPPNHWGQLSSH
jgi:hypothetical protein